MGGQNVAIADQFNLTVNQADFVRHYARNGDERGAYLLAGFAPSGVDSGAWRLLRLPKIIAAVQHETRRLLVASAPMALAVIQGIARDDTMAPKLRLDAAKTLLDRAGLIPPRAATASGKAGIPLNELSVTDLRDLAAKLEGEIATRAKPINAPVARQGDTQAIDLLD